MWAGILPIFLPMGSMAVSCPGMLHPWTSLLHFLACTHSFSSWCSEEWTHWPLFPLWHWCLWKSCPWFLASCLSPASAAGWSLLSWAFFSTSEPQCMLAIELQGTWIQKLSSPWPLFLQRLLTVQPGDGSEGKHRSSSKLAASLDQSFWRNMPRS